MPLTLKAVQGPRAGGTSELAGNNNITHVTDPSAGPQGFDVINAADILKEAFNVEYYSLLNSGTLDPDTIFQRELNAPRHA